MKKLNTRKVKLGNLKIGSKHPVRIKGMIKSPLTDIRKVVSEAMLLEKEGAEAIRIAAMDKKAIDIKDVLSRYIRVPLVADIHFDYRLALAAIQAGYSGIRLNPMNIVKKSQIRTVVREAKKANISIRVGVNSGGFKKRFSSDMALAKAMVSASGDYIKLFEKENFFDTMVSLKAASTAVTILANHLFAEEFSYPLHLGVTATGPYLEGVVKSSLGIGGLLSSGIGSIIRVSLTAPSVEEVRVAKLILEALNLRKFGPRIISCPTCSRCQVDLISVVKRFQDRLRKDNFSVPLNIAIMGCIVNGPGEAYQADIGAAFGKDKCAIFMKDKILGYSNKDRIVDDLFRKIKEHVLL